MISGSLDTNVLIQLLLNDVPKQHLACLRLYNQTEGQLAVSDTALIGAVFVLTKSPYAFTRQQAALVVGNLINLPKLNCNRALFNRALPLFVKHSALSFEDCYLAVYAELNKAAPLHTFDKKLANQIPAAQLIS